MKPALIAIVIWALAPAASAQRISSLAHYRIAELLFNQNNWQSAANEYREVLNGDLDPTWTEVWAHISLGRIFTITGQRDRALNEYKQARKTGDTTFGAQDEVTRLVEEIGGQVKPFPRFLERAQRAEPIESSPAEYTEEARIAEIEGVVLLEGVIGEDGRADKLTVLRPLGLGFDQSAVAAVRQWRFVRSADTQAASKRSAIAVQFFLSSKQSRWHLVRADFNLPHGVLRPTFQSADYPAGAGVSMTATIEEGRLLGAIGRQATATVSFDIDEQGLPVNLQVDAASAAVWGPEAEALVRKWRFKPGVKDGRAVSVPGSVDLVWGPRHLTAGAVERLIKASVGQEIGQK